MTENPNALPTETENAQLRQRVDELNDFIENGSLPLHWVNAQGVIIWANQAELDLLGYAKEEYVGSPISHFHNDSQVIEEILQRLTNNETLNDFPAALKCKDGSIKYVTINSNALFKDGVFVHSRCFTRDVTPLIEEQERKNKLLFLLEESEERLRLAIVAAELGTWDWNPEDGKIYFSDHSVSILDLDSNHSDDKAVSEIIHEDDYLKFRETMRNLRSRTSNSHFNFECRIKKSDLTTFWVKIQGSTYFSSENRLHRILGTLVDITALKKSETKNAELIAIVNFSNDAIVGKTLDGTITSWNYAAQELFGYTADEMVGQSVLQLIPEGRKDEEQHIIERLKAGEAIKHFETKRITKTDHLIDVSLTISPLKDQGGLIFGVSKIARDITEKKQEERRKNDFVSMVSHELKTPLTSILLYAQVLQRKYKNQTDQTDYKMTTVIETQTKKMASMIHDFLNLGRIEEGKLQIRKEFFSLYELCEEARNEAMQMSTQHQIDVSCNENLSVFADRNKIGQVLTNLVSNAIKYSPAGGAVRLRAERQESRVLVEVSDDGVGISMKDQKKLFQRFYRVENEELAAISGFGIGLYIVAEILRYHDTTIEVESREGIGSTFRFYLDPEK